VVWVGTIVMDLVTVSFFFIKVKQLLKELPKILLILFLEKALVLLITLISLPYLA